jgi:hypothetical protein
MILRMVEHICNELPYVDYYELRRETEQPKFDHSLFGILVFIFILNYTHFIIGLVA